MFDIQSTLAGAVMAALVAHASAQVTVHSLGSTAPTDLSVHGTVAVGEQGGADSRRTEGVQVGSRYWSREQAAPGGSNLSNAPHSFFVFIVP